MTFDDDIFAAAATPGSNSTQGNLPVATLQRTTSNRIAPTRRMPPTPTGVPGTSPMPGAGGDDLWSQLINEYGKVDAAFDTTGYDKAAEAEYGNIATMADQSANAAAADYTNRARQAGGSAEGSGLIKAEGLVAGRRTVADAKMKQLQYDIQQKENARQLAADIASKIGGLRMDYLRNLTAKQIAELQASTQRYGYDTEAKWHESANQLGYASLAEQSKEFGWLHPYSSLKPPGSNPSAAGLPGWGGPGSAYDPYPTGYGINTSNLQHW